MSGNLCCFFLCWIECFFFTQTAFQIQMDSNCKGWGPASPFKGFTSTGDHLSNKQTNKEKAFRFPWRRKNGCEQKRRESSEKVAWQQVQSIRGPILSKFISSRCPLTVNTSTSQERPPSFLPSFMPLLVQSHNPSCDNTKWENLLHSTIKLLTFCPSKIELCWGREKLWAIVSSIRKYSRATNKITSSHSAW